MPPVAACGDNVIAVFMAATAAAIPTRGGLGGQRAVAVGVRLPPAAGVGVVVRVCSWGTTAATLAVTRVAVAGVPFRSVAFVEARVDRVAGSVAGLDAAKCNDAADARVACARLVDGAKLGGAALRVLAPRLVAADGVDVGALFGFFASGGLGGNGGLDAAASLGETRALAGSGLAAGRGLTGGGVLAAADRLGAGGGLGAPAEAAAASCLAAIDLTDRARVPASGLAAAFGRRGGAPAMVRPEAGAPAPKGDAASTWLASSACCSSGGRFVSESASGSSLSGGSVLGGSWLGGSPSGGGESAEGLPGAGEPTDGETVLGGGVFGSRRRGAREAGLESGANAPASCGVEDNSAAGSRVGAAIAVGTSGDDVVGTWGG